MGESIWIEMLLLQIALDESPNLGRKHGQGVEVFGLPTPIELQVAAFMSKPSRPARRGMFRWGANTYGGDSSVSGLYFKRFGQRGRIAKPEPAARPGSPQIPTH